MLRKDDYLERAIESFAQIVALILGRTKVGAYEDAQLVLQEAAERYVGLSLRTLDSLSFEGLRQILRVGGSLDIQRCLMLADLQALESQLQLAESRPGPAFRSSSVALRLYVEAADERGFDTLKEHWERADTAVKYLQPFGLEPEVQSALSRYLEARRDGITCGSS